MKFKFHYQSLLEHRRLEEKLAWRDFLEAQQKVEEQKAILKNMTETLNQALTESGETKNSKIAVSLPKLVELDNFMAGQKVKIERQDEIIKRFTAIMEGKQEILISAAKETKILEKLREKQKLNYKKALAKKEAKAMDEVVVTRFRAGGERV